MALLHAHTFEAIGTEWSIETDRTLSARDIRAVDLIIANFDQAYSRFRPDSIVSQARELAPGSFAFPASIELLYDMYKKLEHATNGAVNPLVGATLEHWGYDAGYSLKPTGAAAASVPSFVDALTIAGSTLTYKQPVLLDIGAVGKGLLVDMVAEYLSKHYEQYVVEAGGDMRIATDVPYAIGLEHPIELGTIIGTVEINDKSICGSAPNRRSWGGGLHHIIDARTGKPSNSAVIATWAIADTAMMADALSTALFFAEPDTLQKTFGDFRYLTIRKDGTTMHNMANTD